MQWNINTTGAQKFFLWGENFVHLLCIYSSTSKAYLKTMRGTRNIKTVNAQQARNKHNFKDAARNLVHLLCTCIIPVHERLLLLVELSILATLYICVFCSTSLTITDNRFPTLNSSTCRHNGCNPCSLWGTKWMCARATSTWPAKNFNGKFWQFSSTATISRQSFGSIPYMQYSPGGILLHHSFTEYSRQELQFLTDCLIHVIGKIRRWYADRSTVPRYCFIPTDCFRQSLPFGVPSFIILHNKGLVLRLTQRSTEFPFHNSSNTSQRITVISSDHPIIS
jgi:hypothetical protein